MKLTTLFAAVLALSPAMLFGGEPATECDVLASNPEDPDRRAPPVPREKMDLPKAIAVCEAEMARNPKDVRALYQLARSLIYAGQSERGVALMKQAADIGDRQAQFVYGLLIDRARPGAPRDICIAEPHWLKSARRGRQAARVTYVHHVLRGRFDACKVQASNAEMQEFLAAAYLGSQGCVTLPIGKETVSFTPITVKSALPNPATQAWPMGDVLPRDGLPSAVDAAKIRQAIGAAFDPPEAMTASFVVTWKGRLIGERYGEGITMHTPLESWSMGKSVTATLMGVLVEQGTYGLWERAPIPEWRRSGDPRSEIRIADMLRMSSGLRIRAPLDPDYDASGPYPDHLYLYTGTINSFEYAATRPLQWPPNTVGRYRNTDPVLINYLIRLGVEKRREEYLSFPQRALFDKIGVRTMVMETDPFGNFLTHGYELASARDCARLANFYLQDGVWNGERILPQGYVKFVSSLAPAWKTDGRPIYGGLFWLNGDGRFPVPGDAYYMSGAGGQNVLLIPSHDLVVVRQGHFKGEAAGEQALRNALRLLTQAVPRRSL